MGIINNISEKLGGDTYVSIKQWVDQQNGLSGIIEKFRQKGLSEIIESWINSDHPLPINAKQIEQIFSHDNIANLASKLGLGNNETAQAIAEHLPKIIALLTTQKQNESSDNNSSADNDSALAKAKTDDKQTDQQGNESLLEKGIDFIKDKLLK